MVNIDFKSGFVSIIGKPNVGKSTLMNRLIGEKLSIVTPKPQTTRMNIRGFYNSNIAQIIFLDTPGFLEPRYELHERMMRYITDSIKKSDVIIFLGDIADYPTEYDSKIISLLKILKTPVIGILNKIEMCSNSQIQEKKELLESNFLETFFISALKDNEFNDLISCIVKHLPICQPLYNQEDLSDMPIRFFAQEIIREKIFLSYGKEIPYSSTVVVEKWLEEEERDVIQANIWVERDSQKPIILGSGGVKIGEIRSKAEKDIMNITGRKAVLNLWVKVKHDWRKKNGALQEFGYK